MNFYEALHLTASATSDEIEEAYRKAARKVHPDLHQRDPLPAEARMKLLNQIRDTLTDPQLRAAYDAELAAGNDSTRIETAINETLKNSRDAIIFRKRVRAAIAAGLVVGVIVGLGSWSWFHWKSLESRPDVVSPPTAAPTPFPQSSPTRANTDPSPKVIKKEKKPKVVQFGSSTQDVLNLMGKPDQVEEISSQNLRILHYGQLRLVFRNGKLVPGSGIQQND